MPSGSKKRKAAKKKETEANTAPHSHQGDEDRKVHEENDSDGGEINSPLSQDHHNIQHFAEVEDKREEDTSAIQSAVTEDESVEGVNGYGNSSNKVAADEKSDIQFDREIKLEDGSEPNNVTFGYVEFETKSSSSSSSSSSSDDGSKFANKKIEVINWEEPIEYAPSLPAEAAAVIDLRKISDLPEVTQANEVVSYNLAVVPPKDESYEVVSAEGPSGVSVEPADLPEITPVTETFPVVDDHELALAKSKAKTSNLVPETIPLVEPVASSTEEVHLDEDLGLKVNDKSESLGVSSSVFDKGLQSKLDIISTTATEDREVINVAIVQEDERKTLPQSSVPVVETVNVADHKKDTEIESLDKTTPVALTTRPVQATSCMGCCGLFELFTGSNR